MINLLRAVWEALPPLSSCHLRIVGVDLSFEAWDRLDWLDGLFWGAVLAGGLSVLLWTFKKRALVAVKGREGEDRGGGQDEQDGG